MSFSLEEPIEKPECKKSHIYFSIRRNWVTTVSWQQRTSQGLSLLKNTKLDRKTKLDSNDVVPLWSHVYRRLDTTDQWSKNCSIIITRIGLSCAVSGNLTKEFLQDCLIWISFMKSTNSSEGIAPLQLQFPILCASATAPMEKYKHSPKIYLCKCFQKFCPYEPVWAVLQSKEVNNQLQT